MDSCPSDDRGWAPPLYGECDPGCKSPVVSDETLEFFRSFRLLRARGDASADGAQGAASRGRSEVDTHGTGRPKLDDGWLRAASAEGLFSVEMPGTPSQTERDVWHGYRLRGLRWAEESLVFEAAYWDVPSRTTPNEVFEWFDLQVREDSYVDTKEPAGLGAFPGERWIARRDDDVLYFELSVVRRRCYLRTAIAKAGAAGRGEVDTASLVRFLKSFTVTGLRDAPEDGARGSATVPRSSSEDRPDHDMTLTELGNGWVRAYSAEGDFQVELPGVPWGIQDSEMFESRLRGIKASAPPLEFEAGYWNLGARKRPSEVFAQFDSLLLEELTVTRRENVSAEGSPGKRWVANRQGNLMFIELYVVEQTGRGYLLVATAKGGISEETMVDADTVTRFLRSFRAFAPG